MVVSALYLLAGCAIFGGALQTQQSVTASGRHSAVHAALAIMWLTLGILAFANAYYMSHAGLDGFISYDSLIRITLACQFLLWVELVWLVVIITQTQLTLVPIVLSGVWLFLLIVSIRIPLELFIAPLPEFSQATVGEINNWWVNIYVITLATFFYSLYICYQYYTSGHRVISMLLAGSLLLLLETTIYDLLVTLQLIHSPAITLFGFLALLLLLSFYYLPGKATGQTKLEVISKPPAEPEQMPGIFIPDLKSKHTALPDDSIKSISKALMAIDLYAGMGLRRLKRGANETEKLHALFRKVQTEASYGRQITNQLVHRKFQGRTDNPDPHRTGSVTPT